MQNSILYSVNKYKKTCVLLHYRMMGDGHDGKRWTNDFLAQDLIMQARLAGAWQWCLAVNLMVDRVALVDMKVKVKVKAIINNTEYRNSNNKRNNNSQSESGSGAERINYFLRE